MANTLISKTPVISLRIVCYKNLDVKLCFATALLKSTDIVSVKEFSNSVPLQIFSPAVNSIYWGIWFMIFFSLRILVARLQMVPVSTNLI
jgi:hypothetical protein